MGAVGSLRAGARYLYVSVNAIRGGNVDERSDIST